MNPYEVSFELNLYKYSHGRECDLGKNFTATEKLHEEKPSAT